MTLTQNGRLRILRADDGHLIHRKGDTSHFAPEIYLGTGDSEDNYTELPVDEVRAIEAALEAQQAAQADDANQESTEPQAE